MTSQQFSEILDQRLEAIRLILGQKAGEYASEGDRLYNFKRAGEVSRSGPKKALWGMALKHLVSVIDMVESPSPATVALINEKIGDLINYLILLEAVMKEELRTPLRSVIG